MSDLFDPTETFGDDYLWFYEPLLTPERSHDDVEEIVETLRLAPGAAVLDAPCGHGRIANLLARRGLAVTGVDLMAPFLERARGDAGALGVEVDYRLGDLRDLPVTGPFDAVVCWFTSFGYFDDPDNRSVLRQFADVLAPGGSLVLETMHHDGFVRSFTASPAAVVVERDDDVLVDLCDFDAVHGRVETDRTVHRDGTTRRTHHSIRLPTVPELDSWLAEAGFARRSYADRGGRELRFDSWRLVAVATR